MKLTFGVDRLTSLFRAAFIGFGCLSLVLISNSGTVWAATSTNGASGLSISPLRAELSLKPGQANKIDVTLKNITGGPVVAKASVLDFQSDGTSGNPKIINPSSQSNDPNSIRSFLIGLGNVPLATGQQVTISIPVQAPANASPGAYFGLIAFQAVPQSSSNSGSGSKVALSAAVSQLVFITVPGNVTERMELNNVHIYKDSSGNSEGILFTSPPKAAGIQLSNLGNAFEKPFGNITLQNTEGKTIETWELNGGIVRGIVLPYSSRIYKNALTNIKRPGRYTVVANISYGPGSAILIGKKTFWYIPTSIIIIFIVILLLLIAIALLARRRYKRANSSSYKR